MTAQRYVSDDLTHFVGRSLANEDQRFDLLLKILRAGELRTLRNPDGSQKPGVQTNLGIGWFSERKIHEVASVCFCDIPESDLSIHMKKYSRFGLAFRKSFLLQRGTSPVFYIAMDAITDYKPNVDWAARLIAAGPVSREFFLNSLVSAFYAKRMELFFLLVKQYQASATPEERLSTGVANLLTEIEMLMLGIDREFLSYCVPFQASLSEGHSDNFYMEREWRTIGDIQFNLSDVSRVILPQEWAARFRSAIPEYIAQVSFAD